ncbi:Adenylate kinase 2 [Phytophthora cinnamomi]|uniref:Adenylate kinase 2 n=1 Tax=Phytophthora cinnamomi TaxID=4785 RepID=UPI0035596006|nr:Adenylate kinase 2 [Phytophthora cinnamomi]
MVLVVVEGIVKQAITNGDEIVSTGENVLKLLTGTGALNGTSKSTVDDLQDLINKNSSCGYELKRLTDHVVRAVNVARNSTPDASANDVRVRVYKSSIVMNDIPAVTNMCMGEVLGSKTLTAAFETRDMLRKTFGVIVDQLIDTGTTDMGKNVAKDDYMLKVANMGLVVLSTIDPTGIAYMASQFVQPICGPTAYLALSKIGSVVAVALNLATAGVFGDIYAAYKTAKWAVTCAANVVTAVRGLIYYLRYRQTTAPQGDTAELLAAAYQTDVVVYDLPLAVCTCLGLPVPKNAQFADMVLVVVEGIVKQAITNGDEIVSTGENVLKLLTGTGALNGTSKSTVDDLQDLINKNSSCGYELKRLTDHVVRAVNVARNSTPDASANDVRVRVYKSSIVMNDIPAVTNMCMGEVLGSKTLTAAFETRDMLRKTFGVIVDQLIDTGTTDMGKNVAKDDYMLKVANMGLVVLSTIDPTGIAYMASQFVQPICGPTAYLGTGNGTYGTTIRNWVGPTIGAASDTACYRKTVPFDSNNICPLGYGKDDDDCITQCPMAYPVSCALECIPQNDDCALAVLSKIGSVVAVALNAATGGAFGEILAAYKTAKWAITCAANIVSVVRSLIFYMRYQQTAAPQGDTEQLLTVAYQANVVLIDLPVAVCVCLGLPVPGGAVFADTALTIVEGIVKQAITNGDKILSTGANALDLLTGSGALNSSSTTVDELQELIDKNSTCGWALKSLTDRVVFAINDMTRSSSVKLTEVRTERRFRTKPQSPLDKL